MQCSLLRVGLYVLPLLLGAATHKPACADDDVVQATMRGASWRSSGAGWSHEIGYDGIHGYADRPDVKTLQTITVDWRAPVVDPLGDMCTIRGRLMVSSEGARMRAAPVDWFQGVTVYMGKAPGAKPDWSTGMKGEDTLSDTTATTPSGEFSVRLDLRESARDRSAAQSLQFGLALARHEDKGENAQQVVWTSSAAAIPATVRMMEVPAAPELSRELGLVHQASGWPFANPNGVVLIRAVNALQPLGKEKALAALDKYVELADAGGYRDESDIVFWIIRVLFEPIRLDDRIPVPMIAVYLVDRDSAAAANWPLNPMALVDDVPFMLGQQIGLGGLAEHPSSHITWARRHGVVRDGPLRPGDPLPAARSILASRAFQKLDTYSRGAATRQVRHQALAMVEGIVPPISTRLLDEAAQLREWNSRLEEAARHEIRWHAEHEEFATKGE